MPQFDFFSFFVQLFWLTIGCFTFYLIYTRYIVTNISRILKIREKLKFTSTYVEKDREIVNFGCYDLVLKNFKVK